MPQPAPQPAQSIHLSRSASALPALGGGPPALPPQLPVGVMGRSTSSPASMYAPRDAGVLLDSQPLAPAAGVNGAVLAGLLPLGPPSAPPPCGTPPLRGSGGSSTLVVPCVDAAGRTGNLLVILPAGGVRPKGALEQTTWASPERESCTHPRRGIPFSANPRTLQGASSWSPPLPSSSPQEPFCDNHLRWTSSDRMSLALLRFLPPSPPPPTAPPRALFFPPVSSSSPPMGV